MTVAAGARLIPADDAERGPDLFDGLPLPRIRRRSSSWSWSGRAWLVSGEVADNSSICAALMSSSRSGGFRQFFLASGNGSRRIVGGDIVLVPEGCPSLSCRAFAVDIDVMDEWALEAARRAAATLEAMPNWAASVTAPVETIAVRFSPSGLSRRRRSSGRCALEGAFLSLQCRDIRSNPYLKERLSRSVLDSAPPAADQLVHAIFFRLRADAQCEVILRDSDLKGEIQPVAYYRKAEEQFRAMHLADQAGVCARRRRQVADAVWARSQPDLLGAADEQKPGRGLSELGVAVRQCFAVGMFFRQEREPERGNHSACTGRFVDLGSVSCQRGDLSVLFERLGDRDVVPIVEVGEVLRTGGALRCRVEIRFRSRFADTFGLEVMPDRNVVAELRDGLITASGAGCRSERYAAAIGPNCSASLELVATRAGRHKLLIQVIGSRHRPHVVTLGIPLPREIP
jgi:hypothetical protein